MAHVRFAASFFFLSHHFFFVYHVLLRGMLFYDFDVQQRHVQPPTTPDHPFSLISMETHHRAKEQPSTPFLKKTSLHYSINLEWRE
jgi:hypothetical protein